MTLNVLVVDDSAVMRAMIIKSLNLSGLPLGQIYQAANGEEGLRALRSNWIDLALVDINMPVMNGEEMIEEVRRNSELRDLAIIVVSTESSEARIEMLERHGTKFVHKPFAPETLRETIQKLIGVSDERQVGNGAAQSSGYDF